VVRERLHPRTFLTLILRRPAGVLPVGLRTRRQGLWTWPPSADSGAEATTEDPLLRRRNRRSTNTVSPSQAIATPKISSTAGMVSMIKCRSGAAGTAYPFSWVRTTQSVPY
jgi:hypothetical protein